MPAVQLGELEVIWPLHRWHYLSPALADEGLVMHTDPDAAEARTTAVGDVALDGRALVARALFAGAGCTLRRMVDAAIARPRRSRRRSSRRRGGASPRPPAEAAPPRNGTGSVSLSGRSSSETLQLGEKRLALRSERDAWCWSRLRYRQGRLGSSNTAPTRRP